MEEIILTVHRDEESGWLVAWWHDPDGASGITTQGRDLRDLQEQITGVVAVFFDEGAGPRRIRIATTEKVSAARRPKRSPIWPVTAPPRGRIR